MSDSEEKWLPIPGFEGKYEVSSLGRQDGRSSLTTQNSCQISLKIIIQTIPK